jgi:hypothetical protein
LFDFKVFYDRESFGAPGARRFGEVNMSMLWLILITAAVVGTIMVVLGMFEELPAIIRDVARRSFRQRP